MDKKRIAIVGCGHGMHDTELHVQIAKLKKEDPGCEIIIVDGRPEPTRLEKPAIPDIKLADLNVPLHPKHESQPWSKGYRKDMKRNGFRN